MIMALLCPGWPRLALAIFGCAWLELANPDPVWLGPDPDWVGND